PEAEPRRCAEFTHEAVVLVQANACDAISGLVDWNTEDAHERQHLGSVAEREPDTGVFLGEAVSHHRERSPVTASVHDLDAAGVLEEVLERGQIAHLMVL